MLCGRDVGGVPRHHMGGCGDDGDVEDHVGVGADGFPGLDRLLEVPQDALTTVDELEVADGSRRQRSVLAVARRPELAALGEMLRGGVEDDRLFARLQV